MNVFLIVDNTHQKVIIFTYPTVRDQNISDSIQLATFMWEDAGTNRYIVAHGSTVVGKFPYQTTCVIYKDLGGVAP